MQNIDLICVGKLNAKYFAEGVAEYQKRLAAFASFRIIELPEEKIEEKNASDAVVKKALEKEGKAILSNVRKGAAIVALCIEGKQISSEELARFLADRAGSGALGEALRRINEGASMIRTKGEPGTGDVVQAVRHMRMMNREIARITSMRQDELFEVAKELRVPYELVLKVHDTGRLPVVNFAAGGVATPADAALMMQLGAEGVFVGSGIFKSGNPKKRADAIVKAVTNYKDAKMLAELSSDLGEAMVGINESEIQLLMAERGK